MHREQWNCDGCLKKLVGIMVAPLPGANPMQQLACSPVALDSSSCHLLNGTALISKQSPRLPGKAHPKASLPEPPTQPGQPWPCLVSFILGATISLSYPPDFWLVHVAPYLRLEFMGVDTTHQARERCRLGCCEVVTPV